MIWSAWHHRDRRRVEVKGHEDRPSKDGLRLWVVAEEQDKKRKGMVHVICNNIHALCKCMRALMDTVYVCALALMASLLALLNNLPVLSVCLPSSIHPLLQLPHLSSLFPLLHTPYYQTLTIWGVPLQPSAMLSFATACTFIFIFLLCFTI